MRRKVFIAAVSSLAAALLLLYGACKANDTAGNVNVGARKPVDKAAGTPASGTTEVNNDGVRRVTVEELQAMLADGRAVVYDTRPKTAYDGEHIKGALSMPFDEVEKRSGELPKDKSIVFYCT